MSYTANKPTNSFPHAICISCNFMGISFKLDPGWKQDVLPAGNLLSSEEPREILEAMKPCNNACGCAAWIGAAAHTSLELLVPEADEARPPAAGGPEHRVRVSSAVPTVACAVPPGVPALQASLLFDGGALQYHTLVLPLYSGPGRGRRGWAAGRWARCELLCPHVCCGCLRLGCFC